MTAAPNDGGPAFPTEPRGTVYGSRYDGMSLRDWFAGQALIAIGDVNPHLPGDKANPNIWPEPTDLVARKAKIAYMQADAMLAAREVKP